MDSIFHEKQEGQLCAQHCLNNLLQGPYFSAVDLANFASELDEAEKTTMAEGGFDTTEFLKFMQQPSANMDDSGYFSVQVISKALSVWALSMVPLSSPQMKVAMETPTSQKAYICNHEHHWFTIRKLGKQWFNLNSIQRRPELISDTYLKLFLTQLQLEGYSIFVVTGQLPACEADELLTLVPVQLPPSSSLTWSKGQPSSAPSSSFSSSSGGSRDKGQLHPSATPSSSVSSSSKTSDPEEDYALELAMAMSASMNDSQQQPGAGTHIVGNKQVHVGATTEGGGATVGTRTTTGPGGKEDETPKEQLTPEQLREKRLKHFT